MYDLIVIGAGAAGLCAAIRAKKNNKACNILIIEKQTKCGRKLSASGNGRCNVTNDSWNDKCFVSSDEAFIQSFVKRHSPDEVKDFFEDCGILLSDNNGYYYPISNQAKQVTEKLLRLCGLLGVSILNDTEVTDIKTVSKNSDKYIICSDHKEYITKAVIIACGSNACGRLGGSDSGYKLMPKLGFELKARYPGLSSINIDDDRLYIAKGVRHNCSVTLHIDDIYEREDGQVQFNEDNISGIAIMNLSNRIFFVGKRELKDAIFIDAMPQCSWDRLKDFFLLQIEKYSEETVLDMLKGLLPLGLSKYILARTNIDSEISIGKLSDKQLNRITSLIKKMTFNPVLNNNFEKAQVSIGGVSTREINEYTFESKKHPGIYIVGELLDMTGKCGGYNISFAVLSGIDAANAITM